MPDALFHRMFEDTERLAWASMDEVHDRARHRVRRNRVAIVTAAAVMVGIVAGGVAAARTDGLPAPQPGTSPTTGQPVVPPEPTPPPRTKTPPPTVNPTPQSSATGGGLPPVPGRIVYLDGSGALRVGGKRYRPAAGPNLWASGNVAPDGKWITWVTEDGDLFMSRLDGSGRRALAHDAEPYCVEPVWSADSTRILYQGNPPGGPDVVITYLTGGAGDHLGDRVGCHYRWSADGKRIAVTRGDLSGVVVMDTAGGNRTAVTNRVLDGREMTGAVSISADGGRICLATQPPGQPLGDVTRRLACDTVVDVEAKKVVPLPVPGKVLLVLFQTDGGMLVRVDDDGKTRLFLLDAAGRQVARSTEPASSDDWTVLTYLP